MSSYTVVPMHSNILTTLRLILDNLPQLQVIPLEQRATHFGIRMARRMIGACPPLLHDEALTHLKALVDALITPNSAQNLMPIAKLVETYLQSA